MNFQTLGSLAAATALAFMALSTTYVRPTFACSGGSDWNPVEESEVIVAGEVLGWEVVDRPSYLPEDFMFETIQLRIAVEDVLKGEAPALLEVIDTASLDAQTGTWHGNSGACGAFNADPTGSFIFAGLMSDEEGHLRTNLLLNFYVGDRSEFTGLQRERTGEILSSFGLERLPEAGHGPMTRASRPDYERLAIATLLIAIGFAVMTIARRSA